jgi:hypothetical protein
MSPLVSSLLIGAGAVAAACGLAVLLAGGTGHRRAKPTLRLWGRDWPLWSWATAAVLAGSLCLAWPLVSGPPAAPDRLPATAEFPAPPDDAMPAPAEPDRAEDLWRDADRPDPGAPGSGSRPAPNPAAPAPAAAPLAGDWVVTNTVVETSYPPYRDLRLGFRVRLRQEGVRVTGHGEKYLENGRRIPASARRPIRLEGHVVAGGSVEVTFEEDGHARRTEGRFRLTPQGRQSLTGTFASTAANARGVSQWQRAVDSTPAPAPHAAEAAANNVDAPPIPARVPTQRRPPGLELGMSQAQVRDVLGAPAGVEEGAGFVFWHYGTDAHERDVVFEQGTGRVQGWVGFPR